MFFCDSIMSITGFSVSRPANTRLRKSEEFTRNTGISRRSRIVTGGRLHIPDEQRRLEAATVKPYTVSAAKNQSIQKRKDEFRDLLGTDRKIILSIDRLDYSKGMLMAVYMTIWPFFTPLAQGVHKRRVLVKDFQIELIWPPGRHNRRNKRWLKDCIYHPAFR